MSRYIDAEEAIKAIEDLPNAYNGWSDTYDKAYIISTLEEVPTADVIPRDYYEKVVSEMAKRNVEAADIVRCKECDMSEVYQNDSSGVMARYCRAFAPNRMVADDDFCSYGERASDE